MAYSAPFTYTIDSPSAGLCTITACDAINGVLTIPETLGGYTVRTVASNACKTKGITSIGTIPSGLINIGYSAFEGNSIADLVIPSTCTYLATNCFKNNNIATLTINSNTSGTPTDPFYGCSLGDGVTLGASVTAVGTALFKNSGITSITFPASVTSVLTSAFESTLITDLVIPSTLVSLAADAFKNTNLTTVTLNATVTSTYTSPFKTCSIGDGLTIGEAVTAISANLFKESGLTSVTFPASVTTIGADAFRNNALLTIDLPETVTTVGASAFAYNTGLAEVIVRNDTITLGLNILTGNMSASPKGVIYGNDPSNAKTWYTNYWTATYTFEGIPTSGWVKRWDGAAWVIVTPKRWDGAAWVDCTPKRWDGAAWV